MDATTRRFLAGSSIGGGVLRIASAFTTDVLNPQVLQVTYALTDVLLLLGLAGMLLAWRTQIERLGFAGVAIAAIGLTMIRATGFTALAMSGYRIGAGIALIGVTLLSVDLLWRRVGSCIAPYFWIASFGLAVWGAFGGQAALQALAGVAFGAGFAVAGIELFTAKTQKAALQ